MKISEYEKLQPTVSLLVNETKLKFYVPNSFVLWRAETLMTKEPTTIEWLDSMNAGEELLDIGANVGGYTIYASKVRGVRVNAIEPEAQNFNILCQNIRFNQVQDLVQCWPIGLTDVTKFEKLYISDTRAGGSCHSVGEQVDFKLQPKKFPFNQGCFSTTVDKLVEDGVIPPPDHIKLDVDGLEHKVIAGALQTLKSHPVKSLSIEVNPSLKEHQGLIQTLTDLGFKTDEAQIARARRQSGTFEGVAEYVFRRDV
jgi:FkbM family methyltransferase